ncbi:MAG: hypothetical protein E7236_05150 [Lachnospiraceae bacterium]|nr:hypothetical protein [Lachnospiraceae bacterium]
MKTYDTDLRGKLCVSLCGHDKGKIYVIIASDDEEVLLADGESRTLDRPKKKNRRHIQPIIHLPEDVREALGECTDLTMKRALRLYKQAEV